MRSSRRVGAGPVIALLFAITALFPGAASAGHDGPLPFTQVSEPGFTATPYLTGVPTPAALSFGPDGRLYVVSWITGRVLRTSGVGEVAGGPPEIVIEGLDRPLGLAWGPDEALYVTSVDANNPRGGRPWGMVTRFRIAGSSLPLQAAAGERVLEDVPGGIHTLSGITFGPRGDLYVGVASASENGDSAPGETPEVPPVTLAVLRTDPDHGALSAIDDLVTNGRTKGRVDVVATGIHNAHDLAFRGSDLWTASNGPQGEEPLGEDLVYRMATATRASLASRSAYDFGSPGCLYTHDEIGQPVGRPSSYEALPEDERTCEGRDRPAAALGLHRGATGLAFAPAGFGDYGGDLFVAEFGSLPPFSTALQGHKIVRLGIEPTGGVRTDPGGRPDLADFLATGAPMDVAFHDGAMYVADFGGAVVRVVPTR